MPIQTLTTRRIDFTSRDFDSWLTELRSIAQSVLPQWTDFNRANIGNLFLELMAHTVDIDSYSIDQQTNEKLTILARLRKSMIDLGKLVGFTLPGATEASVDLEFTITSGNVHSQDIIIPAGTQVKAPDIQNPITFYTVAEARIVQGTLQITGVAARHAEPQSETFVADGSATQRVLLSQTPYLDGTAQITIGGDTYLLVDNLLEYGSTDKVFMVEVDESDQGTAIFGDGVNGNKPIGSGQVDYETGGGEQGNVDPNAITDILTVIQDALGANQTLTVRNPIQAAGGTNRMSVEEARVAIPESVLVANLVTCTSDQFEINPRQVRGVARSLVLTHDEDTSIPEYTANVYIVPVGGGLPSTALKAEVLTMITATRPQPIGMDVFVLNPELGIISIAATVYLESGVSEVTGRANIEASLASFFALNNSDGTINRQIDFGYHIKNAGGSVAAEIPWSDLFNAVRDAVGIRKVDKSSFVPASDVALDLDEFPYLGSITLVNGDTSAVF